MNFEIIVKHKALRALKNCAHPLGFKASALKKGYPHVWARDSMITSLGALVSGDKKLIASVEASLESLVKYQTKIGAIPTNVDTRTKHPEPHNQTQVDSSAWYVIGLANFVQAVKPSRAFLKRHFGHAEAAMQWLMFQDQNNDGLIELQEAWDWEDLFAIRGTGLYVNVLWYAALNKAVFLARKQGKDAKARQWIELARHARRHLNERLWDTFPPQAPPKDEWQFARMRKGRNGPFYFPYYTFWRFGRWCDALGNLLAILFGVSERAQALAILNYMSRSGMALPYPTKAIDPPITPQDNDWREYYRKHHLNLPHQYHNGGIWPFIGGFHVAALVKTGLHKEADKMLMQLVEANRKGTTKEWEFNEWLHGKTGKPSGMAEQAWSAGMLLYALESVQNKKSRFFE